MQSFIDNVRSKANGHWEHILQRLDIPINKKEGPCPACGGKTRYRFDDLEGRGTYYCSHCKAGTGLDLVMKVKGCNATEAATIVAEAMALPLPQPEKTRKPAKEKPVVPIAHVVDEQLKLTHMGESVYLKNKGLGGRYPLDKDGSLFLPIQRMDGLMTGAQIIRSNGKKSFIPGTKKKGSFIPVGDISASPETVVITEGYATALSLDGVGSEVILAALDVGNLLPVAQVVRERWPQAIIIIAADNDVSPDGDNVGKQAAEKAALAVSGLVALPPTEEKADWNDFFQKHGIEALEKDFVRSTYVPKQLEQDGVEVQDVTISANEDPSNNEEHTGLMLINNGEDKNNNEDEHEKIPSVIIDIIGDSVYLIDQFFNKLTKTIDIERKTWLCSAIKVLGIGTSGREHYAILQWYDRKLRKDTVHAIPLADIGEREGWRTLKYHGIKVTSKPKMRPILADWIQRQASKGVWSITPRSGWHKGAYIMPDGSIIGEPEQPVLFNGGTAAREAYSIRGDLKSWRDNVARLAEGNPFQILTVGVALSAPMLPLVGADGFGVHLYAHSTAGKTTAQDLGASLYGNPDPQRLSWYGTALGIANEAEAHNHGLMALDEIGESTPQSVHTCAYTLFNGKGKLQGHKDGGNREQKYWKTTVISTGEHSVEAHLRVAGIQVKAGQLVRLLNIPVTTPTILHGYSTAKDHADALKDAWLKNHGAAGRAWVWYLSKNTQKAIDAYKQAKMRWRSYIPASYGEQVHRVADRFAIIEAALIVGKVITGWSEYDCQKALEHIFNEWVNAFGTGNKEIQQIIDQANAFLHAHGMSRFAPLDYDQQGLPIRDLAGYRESKSYGDVVTFYVLPDAFNKEVAKGFDPKLVAKVLHDAGMLMKPAKGNRYQKLTPHLKHLGGIRQRAYVLRQVTVDDDD